jgi:outer membrane lipoprotein-sorting protein
MQRYLPILAPALCFLFPASAADFDTIESEVLANWEKVKTLSFTVKEDGKHKELKGTGIRKVNESVEIQRVGDEDMKIRVDVIQNETWIPLEGKTLSTDSTSLRITTADATFWMSEVKGQPKTAMKTQRGNTTSYYGGKLFFKRIRHDFNLTVLDNETVNNIECYVVECAVKTRPDVPPLRYWFSKSSPVWVQYQSRTKEGIPFSTQTISNVKLNPSILASRFEFVPPPGVQVLDATQRNPTVFDLKK